MVTKVGFRLFQTRLRCRLEGLVEKCEFLSQVSYTFVSLGARARALHCLKKLNMFHLVHSLPGDVEFLKGRSLHALYKQVCSAEARSACESQLSFGQPTLAADITANEVDPAASLQVPIKNGEHSSGGDSRSWPCAFGVLA